MHVLTNERMRKVDEETIARFYPGLELMERAGRGIADLILEEFSADGFKAAIFVGPGNNGGDALVVARYLSEAGRACTVHYMAPPEKFSMDALKNHQRLQDRLASDKGLKEVHFERPDWQQVVRKGLVGATMIVDGLFGTGLTRPLEGDALEVVRLINASGLPVVSIDTPSGVNGDSGEILGEAVRATYTVTMGFPKLGMLFYPGKAFVGRMSVVDLGFPEEVLQVNSLGIYLLDLPAAARRLPARRPDIHKYQAGTVLLASGSRAYTGATLLCAEAALRSGCGMVYAAVPASIQPVIQSAFREAVVVALPETTEGGIAESASSTLRPYVERADTIVVGPGLGREDETERFVRDFVAGCRKPLVLDADGINAFAGRPELLAGRSTPTAVTPHSGELARLVGHEIPSAPQARVEKTREIARALGVTLVHKGAPTLVASPEGDVWVNHVGSSALATGGTGDVLTGIVAGLAAQAPDVLNAAAIACVAHGRAGERAAQRLGDRAVIAGDLLVELGPTLVEIESSGPKTAGL